MAAAKSVWESDIGPQGCGAQDLAMQSICMPIHELASSDLNTMNLAGQDEIKGNPMKTSA